MATPSDNSASGYQGSDYDSSLELQSDAKPKEEVTANVQPKVSQVHSSSGRSKKVLLINVVVLGLIIIIGTVGFLLSSNAKQPNTKSKVSNYSVTSVPTKNVQVNQELEVQQASQLSINGQVRVGSTLVIAPGSVPSSPVAGQIYYSQSTNQLYYYNNQKFVSLNSGQTPTVQGGTGTVKYSSGAGISLNGTLISNNGVTSISGTPNQITANNSTGSIKLSLPQNIDQSASPTFGDLTLADLNQSGVLYGGGSQPIESIVASSANLCLISTNGAPYWGGCASAGITGTTNAIPYFTTPTTLGSSILSQNLSEVDDSGSLNVPGTISGVGSGITDITADNIQNGGTAIFTSGVLGVANGGTGAATGAGARTNLGAAASGQNDDITELDDLSVIGTSGNTIEVPNTSGTLAVAASGPIGLDSTGTITCAYCLVSNNASGGTLGVTTVQGQTGDITLTAGSGIAINGTTISNTGILAVSGDPNGLTATNSNGSVELTLAQAIDNTASPQFTGLTLSGLDQYGVLIGGGSASAITSVQTSTAGECLVSTVTTPEWDVSPGGGGTISGTQGDIAYFTGSTTLGSSVLSQGTDGSTGNTQITVTGELSVTQGIYGDGSNITNVTADNIQNGGTDIFTSGVLGVANGGTGAADAPDALINLGAAASGENDDITELNDLSSIGTGGITINVPNNSGTLAVAASGPIGLDSTGTITCTTCITDNGTTGTQGDIAYFTGSTTLGSSVLSQGTDGSTGNTQITVTGELSVTQGIYGDGSNITNVTADNIQNGGTDIFTSGVLGVANGGTGAADAPDALINLGAAASGENDDITELNDLSSIGTGGITINVPNNSGTLAVAASGPIGLDSTGTITCTTCITDNGTTGTQGDIAYFTGSTTLGSSVLSQGTDGSTGNTQITVTGELSVTQGIYGDGSNITNVTADNIQNGGTDIFTSGVLGVANGGTGATTAPTARTSLGAAASGENDDIYELDDLSTINPASSLFIGSQSQDLNLIGVAQNGSGNSNISVYSSTGGYVTSLQFTTPTQTANITVPNTSGTVTVAASGPLSLSTGGVVSCATCLVSSNSNGGIVGVQSVNSANGAITLLQGAGISISTNTGTGQITIGTAQDISQTATPTFAGLRLTIGDLGVDTTSPNYPVDVNGNINTNGDYLIDGSPICTSGGCAVVSGSGSYIQNSTAIQSSANFAIQGVNGSSPVGVLKEASGTVTSNVFQVESSVGSSYLAVGPTGNVGILNTNPNYPLDVSGNINTTGELLINGSDICDSSGCSVKSGSSNYIQNTVSQQSGNVNLTTNNNSVATEVIQATNTQSGDLLDLENSSGSNVLSVSPNGTILATNSLSVGTSSTSNALNVGGNLSISATGSVTNPALIIGGNTICTSAGCEASGGTGTYVDNNYSSAQPANIYVQSPSATPANTPTAILQASSNSGDILDLKNNSGSNVFSVNPSGNEFVSASISIATSDTTYALNVNGDINLTGNLLINGTPVCSGTTCSGGSGSTSGSYLLNSASLQSGNLFLQNGTGNTTSNTVSIEQSAGQTGDLLNLLSNTGQNLASFNSQGALIVAGNGSHLYNGVLNVGANTTSASGGIYFGTDGTDLYRSGAQALTTGGSFEAAEFIQSSSASSTGILLESNSSSSSSPYLTFSDDNDTPINLSQNGSSLVITNSSGVQEFGFNTVNQKLYFGTDTSLYRSSSNSLTTSGNLTVGGLLSSTDQTLVTSNSTTAFVVQNTSLADLLVADTTDMRVGINTTPGNIPNLALDVNGDINTSGVYKINDSTICQSSGCTPASGSPYYIQNGNITQLANFSIQSNVSLAMGAQVGLSSPTAVIQQYYSSGTSQAQTGDLLQLEDYHGTTSSAFSASGAQLSLDYASLQGALSIGTASDDTAADGIYLEGGETDLYSSGSGILTTDGQLLVAGANSLTLGAGSNVGSVIFNDGGSDTTTITPQSSPTGSYNIILPNVDQSGYFICTSDPNNNPCSNFISSGGGATYLLDTTTQKSENFNIISAAGATSPTGVLGLASGQTGDILDFDNGATVLTAINASGELQGGNSSVNDTSGGNLSLAGGIGEGNGYGGSIDFNIAQVGSSGGGLNSYYSNPVFMLQGGSGSVGAGAALFQNAVDSAAAFQIMDAASDSSPLAVLNVNTTTTGAQLTIQTVSTSNVGVKILGASSQTGDLLDLGVGSSILTAINASGTLQGGNATSTNTSGRNLSLAGGIGEGNGYGGSIDFNIAQVGSSGGGLNSYYSNPVFMLQGGSGSVGAGAALFQNAVDSAVALQIKNASSNPTVVAVLDVNTLSTGAQFTVNAVSSTNVGAVINGAYSASNTGGDLLDFRDNGAQVLGISYNGWLEGTSNTGLDAQGSGIVLQGGSGTGNGAGGSVDVNVASAQPITGLVYQTYASTATNNEYTVDGASGVAYANGNVYWMNGNDHRAIYYEPTNGTGGPVSTTGASLFYDLNSTAGQYLGLATDGTYLYWYDSTSNSISRMNLNGNPATYTQSFISNVTNSSNSDSIVPDCGAGKTNEIYYSLNNGILEAPCSGGTASGTTIIDDTNGSDFSSCGMTSYDGYLYWVNNGPVSKKGVNYEAIQAAPLSNPTNSTVVNVLNYSGIGDCGVAVDSLTNTLYFGYGVKASGGGTVASATLNAGGSWATPTANSFTISSTDVGPGMNMYGNTVYSADAKLVIDPTDTYMYWNNPAGNYKSVTNVINYAVVSGSTANTPLTVATFSGYNGSLTLQNGVDSTQAFVVQNAKADGEVFNILQVDTIDDVVGIGLNALNPTVAGGFASFSLSVSGSVNIANDGGSNGENTATEGLYIDGTQVCSVSGCSLSSQQGSGGIANGTTQQAGANIWIQGLDTVHPTEVLQADTATPSTSDGGLLDFYDSVGNTDRVLSEFDDLGYLQGGNSLSTTVNGTGGALTIGGGLSNGSGNGGDIDFLISQHSQAGSKTLNSYYTTPVLNIAGATGAATFQNAVDSSTALQVMNASTNHTITSVLVVNTSSSGAQLTINTVGTGNTGISLTGQSGGGDLIDTYVSGNSTPVFSILGGGTIQDTVTNSGSSANSALVLSGLPSKTVPLLQVGSVISSGNASGTYIGINEPSSGFGSGADFLDFQAGGTKLLQASSNGALFLGGYTEGTTAHYDGLYLGSTYGQQYGINFDSGVAEDTVDLYAVSASTVQTDANFVIGGNLTVNGTNTSTTGPLTISHGAISSSATLSVSYGGTGAATLTSGDILEGNGTSAITAVGTLPTGVQGNITSLSSAVTLGTSSSTSQIVLYPGSAKTVTLQSAAQNKSTIISIPTDTTAGGTQLTSDTICLQTLNNCNSAGASITNGTAIQTLSNFNIQEASTGTSSTVPTAVITAISTTQPDLLAFDNSSGVELTGVSATGVIHGGNATSGNNPGSTLSVGGGLSEGTGTGGSINFEISQNSAASGTLNSYNANAVLSLAGSNGSALFLNTADSTAALEVRATSTDGSTNVLIANTTSSGAQLIINTVGSTNVGLVVNGANNVSDADLIEAKNGTTTKFSVSGLGNVTAGTINGATISGGTLSGGTLSGGTVSGGTLTGTAVNGLNVSASAVSTVTSNSSLTLDANGTGTVSIGTNSTGNVILGGTSVTPDCTLTNSSGAWSCRSTINGATISGGTLSGGTLSGGTVSGGTLTGTAVNGLNVSASAVSTVTSNSSLTLDANGTGTVSIGTNSTGNVILGGTSVTPDCTLTNSSGAWSCRSTINGATISGGTLSGGTLSGGTVSGGTLTGTAVNGLNVSASAVSTVTSNSSLTLDANGTGTVSIGTNSTGNVILGGTSVTPDCTLTNSSGAWSCRSTINGATISGGTLSGGTLSGGTVSGGTLTGTAVNGLNVSASAVSTVTSNSSLTLDANGTGTVSIGTNSTGNVILGGTSVTPDCTLTNSSGNFNCSGTLNGLSVNGGVITQNSANDVGIILKDNTSDTGNLLQARDSSNNLLAWLDYKGNLTVQALEVKADLTLDGHFITTGSAPSISCGAAAGSGSQSCTITGNDTFGTITIHTGSTTSSNGILAQIGFNRAFTGNAPNIVISPSSQAAAGSYYYTGCYSGTGCTTASGFNLNVNATPPVSQTLIFNYFVGQSQ